MPINFSRRVDRSECCSIVETEVLYHPLDGPLISITNYVAQERLTERIREWEKEDEGK